MRNTAKCLLDSGEPITRSKHQKNYIISVLGGNDGLVEWWLSDFERVTNFVSNPGKLSKYEDGRTKAA